MNDLPLYQQIEVYFAQKVEERRSLSDIRPLDGRPDSRAECAQRIHHPENIDILSHLSDKPLPCVLDFPLFELWFRYDSLIVTLDDQQDIIWIDDPLSDEDFSYFLRKEHLFERNLDALALSQLICRTKLNYLMRGIVISHVDDIPLSDYQKTFYYRLKLLLFQARFRISPPSVMLSAGITRLGFTLKTHFGEIIKIDCMWDGNHFAYRGRILGKSIGFSAFMI